MHLFELFQKTAALFVSRPVINGDAITQWAKDHGFASTLGDDLHVTIAYSKQPVDWRHFTPEHRRLTVRGGGRRLQRLGDDGAVVLVFASKHLQRRWQQFCDGGASWDHAGYLAHVTISYAADRIDLDAIEPFAGDLELGPEKFRPVDDSWRENLDEVDVT